jgi:hypothetical protein
MNDRLPARCFAMLGALLLGAAFVPSAASAADKAGSAAVPQREVYIGIYLNQIIGMSLKEEKVQVDFHVWFRWKGDDLKPLETFDLTNGDVDQKQDVFESMSGDYHYAVCRCLATIQKMWNVHDFPLDDHDITLEIEDSDQEEFKLRYIADVANCNLNPDARVAGWNLADGGALVVSHRTNTNYGDIALPTGSESIWSRFIYTCHMTRPGYGYFTKLFTGLFIAASIALVGLLIPASELDSRFALSVGAMFAAVASEYVVTAALPDSNTFTMADKLHILSFLFIFVTLVESTVSHKVAGHGMLRAAFWIDRVMLMVLGVTYATLIATIVLVRG